MQFFERIRERREKLNISQEELAKRLGYKSRSSINKIEIGENDIPQSKIKAFADALQTTPSYLMGWNDDDSASVSNSSSLPPLTTKDERSIQKRLESVLNDLMPDSSLAYYDGDEPMSDDDKELLRISLENTMRLAKQMAKQKFTPKKYRK